LGPPTPFSFELLRAGNAGYTRLARHNLARVAVTAPARYHPGTQSSIKPKAARPAGTG
jgi:hypothetical protein